MFVYTEIKKEYSDLPARIQAARMADKRSLLEICRQLDMSVTHWHRIERGEPKLPIGTLRNIERVLGVEFGIDLEVGDDTFCTPTKNKSQPKNKSNRRK